MAKKSEKKRKKADKPKKAKASPEVTHIEAPFTVQRDGKTVRRKLVMNVAPMPVPGWEKMSKAERAVAVRSISSSLAKSAKRPN